MRMIVQIDRRTSQSRTTALSRIQGFQIFRWDNAAFSGIERVSRPIDTQGTEDAGGEHLAR